MIHRENCTDRFEGYQHVFWVFSMAALKRTVDLSGEDIQQAWKDVRDDAAETNWYSRLLINLID